MKGTPSNNCCTCLMHWQLPTWIPLFLSVGLPIQCTSIASIDWILLNDTCVPPLQSGSNHVQRTPFQNKTVIRPTPSSEPPFNRLLASLREFNCCSCLCCPPSSASLLKQVSIRTIETFPNILVVPTCFSITQVRFQVYLHAYELHLKWNSLMNPKVINVLVFCCSFSLKR